MKKMTKWLAVCAVCVMGSVPAMAAEVPDVTVTPIPIETPAPDVTPIETPAPTPIPEVKNGWCEYGTKNKKYFKDGQYLTGMRKIHDKQKEAVEEWAKETRSRLVGFSCRIRFSAYFVLQHSAYPFCGRYNLHIRLRKFCLFHYFTPFLSATSAMIPIAPV